MPKFSGKIGFGFETKVNGVVTFNMVERYYKGDILQDNIHSIQNENLNDNVKLVNRISIISNKYATENLHLIKYVIYMGVKWKVSTVEVKPPRIILNFGGVYNGK